MPTARVVLDTRYQHQDDLYPVKIRVGHQRRARYYNVVYQGVQVRMSEQEFRRAAGKRPTGDAALWSQRFKGFELKADTIIRELSARRAFSFDAFRERWSEKLGDRGNVFFWYDKQMEKFEDSPGTIEKYQYSRESLKKFCDCEDLAFADVTEDWLRRYERWMVDQGRSVTTVAIHLRTLRAVFNRARAEEVTDLYPFGKHRYQIPRARSSKRPLTPEQLLALYEYRGEPGSLDELARDMFIFSYLLAGLNMADIFRIRWEHIEGDTLRMERTKTGQQITLHIPDDAWAILRRHAGQRQLAGYVFPYLRERMSETKKRNEVRRLTARINEHLQALAPVLGLPDKITTYWARHTFATIAKNAGLPTTWIQEALSHSSQDVTQNYLSEFADEQRREFTRKISVWK